MAITIPDPCDRLFSVDDYYRMAEAGVIQPSERVELIKGKIVSTTVQAVSCDTIESISFPVDVLALS